MSSHRFVKDKHNDTLQYKPNPKHLAYLKEKLNIDDRLAHHVASLFIRDPIPAYSKELREFKG